MITNGATTWADEDEIPNVGQNVEERTDLPPMPEIRSLGQLARRADGGDEELLKTGFLCRGGGALLVGQTGIGKSSLALQFMVAWSLGKDAFGIVPARPLDILLVQAENDDGDVAEARDGIFAGMNLTDEEKTAAGRRINVIHENSLAGDNFIAFLDSALAEHPIDLLVIDPALAYIPGDASSQRDVSEFLRRGINPLLARHNCGVLLVHHTNKPPNEKPKVGWQAGELAYAGSGSAEWANWARAVMTLRSTGNYTRFDLILGKRGSRVGWKNPDDSPRYVAHLEHSKVGGQIHWREMTEEEYTMEGNGSGPTVSAVSLLQLVPEDATIAKDALVSKAQNHKIGLNKARGFIAELIQSGDLFEWKVSRSGTRPSIHLAKSPQPVEGSK